nr:MAG TPA: hypothetical protein [Caudoviricetes sp.]
MYYLKSLNRIKLFWPWLLLEHFDRLYKYYNIHL